MQTHWYRAILAGVATCLVAGVSFAALSASPMPRGWGVWLASCLIGGLIGFAAWRIAAALQRDIRRLVGYLHTLSGEGATLPPRLGFGLGPAANVAAQTIQAMSERLDEMTRLRRELELRSRVSEAERGHLEAILNAITDGVVVTDAFDEVKIANGAAAQVLDFELQPALRRPLDEVTEDARLIKLIKDTRDAGANQRRGMEHRVGGRSFRVTTTCVAGRGVAAPGAAGAAGVVTVLHDVTRDKEIAEMKSDFVSKVSHELRTPLSSIKAYVEMLIDGEAHDEDTRSEFYGIVQNETDRLQRMIDNILSISRIESGVTKVHREQVELAVLVNGCVEVVLPQARDKGVTLDRLVTEREAVVFADRDMLVQAVMNVVSNAVKYTPAGGTVGLAMVSDGPSRTVTLSVTDTGVGIPAEDVPRLFQKFYRVPSNNTVAPGTGLGLNLVKHVVENVHAGSVSVESTVGHGTTFKMALPLADIPSERGADLLARRW